MATAEEIKFATRKRGTKKAQLTSFEKYINGVVQKPEALEETELVELQERYEKIGVVREEFERYQDIIEENVEDDQLELQLEEREKFEDTYFRLISKAKKLLYDYNVPVDTQSVNSSPEEQRNSPVLSNHNNQNQALQSIRLPKIDIPKFDGNYDQWLEFRDTFMSLIHENETLTNVQKFHYLRASLVGDAAQVIKSMELSTDNYTHAWDILCERYNNTNLLIDNHVQGLFNIEKLTKESSSKLRKLIDNVSKHLRALESLQQETQHWDTLIIHMVIAKLDDVTLREWQQKEKKASYPTWEEFKTFLQNHANLLEVLENKQTERKTTKILRHQSNTKTLVTTHKMNCSFCKGGHAIYNCDNFLKLSNEDRLSKVKEQKLCMNCLKSGHFTKVCKSGSCKYCKAKHNSLLHSEKQLNENKSHVEQKTAAENNTTLITRNLDNFNVLLPTARVNIIDNDGKIHSVVALLDSGSQSNYITSKLCDQLNCKITQRNITVMGLNNSTSEIKTQCEVNMQSTDGQFNIKLTCLVTPEITGQLPNFKFDRSLYKIPNHIRLANPEFNKPTRIDILIGAQHFWNILNNEKLELGNNSPILQNTRLGWIISGPLHYKQQKQTTRCHFSQQFDIQQELRKFWEIEEVSSSSQLLSREEEECELHFQNNVKRDSSGRFIVSIPFKESTEKLGESREQAEKRFFNLERKLQAKPPLREMYIHFMEEYERLQHMSKCEETNSVETSYFMPHHGVFREHSESTKLRVVFDASAPTTSGYSLNDLQMVGATIQNDLLSIILNFRRYTYGISSDIQMMYRMVLIDPNQRSLQKIIWRNDQTKPVSTYTLNTVTYGTTSAPFLAVRCLMQLAEECKLENPKICDIIKTQFYVDDYLGGADSIEEGQQICQQLSEILQGGGFTLRKWISNEPKILQNVEVSKLSLNLGAKITKTLGLTWSCETDSFIYDINTTDISDKKITKRSILSTIAQIFDPLGLLSPCIILAKIIIQKLWLEKLEWDQPAPLQIIESWSKFQEELPYIQQLHIPRHVLCKNVVTIELHGFSDACETSYGACVYLRSIDNNGTVTVRLLCAKSKVAPLKSVTIPRLELLGALMLARIFDKIKGAMKINFSRVMFWCDSTIALSWIKTEPHLLKTFVSNRASEIQNLTSKEDWYYVSSLSNPADIVSRGMSPKHLIKNILWWEGPEWLSAATYETPTQPQKKWTNEHKEQTKTLVATESYSLIPYDRFSSLRKLQRVIAYCIRFKTNCTNSKEQRTSGPLTYEEIKNSQLTLIKDVQRVEFFEDLKQLSTNQTVNKKSKLHGLHPFIHVDGTVRVGGRLTNSNFEFDKKHPIVLPNRHPFTRLLLEEEHLRLYHAGPQQLVASIREHYWPISVRNLAKGIVRKCVRCFKTKPSNINPLMGSLPKHRTTPSSPFFVSGVDYAGPLWIKDKPGRGSKKSKCYICIFVCFSTKAVHLEAVSSLTTEAFIMTLRRFASRRGMPQHIYSDNGSNFVGAQSELKELGQFLKTNEDELSNALVNDNCNWHFIPAYSPHMGGLWEAGVKATKHHLVRVMGNSLLTFEQLYTVLVQIEGILNSRPLTPLSNDPNDFTPLTPAHFLIGRSISSVPDPNVTEIPEFRLNIYQKLQRLNQHYWQRWQKEYISELQQRTKWKTLQQQVKLGTLVLIKDDNLVPLRWKLGRIIKLHPGKDGIARVASVKTSTGLCKRALSKLCPLPIDNGEVTSNERDNNELE